LCWLDEVGVYFKSKGSKVLIVDSSSGLNILFDVFAHGFEDKMELGLWIEGFGSLVCSGLRMEMFSWVVIGVFNDPRIRDKIPSKNVVVVHDFY
jgi:hypothetical protein